MKEIRFRVKLVSDSIWHYYSLGDLVSTLGREGEEYIGETWSQFTGLKDKNGLLIYEGDILKQDIQNEFGSLVKDQIGQMVWHKHGCWAIKYESDSPLKADGFCPPPEIIGNVWDNPELLPPLVTGEDLTEK